jgi:TPR repeat protein
MAGGGAVTRRLARRQLLVGGLGWVALSGRDAQAVVLAQRAAAASDAVARSDRAQALPSMLQVLRRTSPRADHAELRQAFLVLEGLAAGEQDPRAGVALAWALWRGLGTTPNDSAALHALRPWVERRWPRALYLAWWIQRDAAPARGKAAVESPSQVLREAAAAGDAPALNAMGVHAALHDDATSRSPSAAAMAWFVRAAQAGSAAANVNLQSARGMSAKSGDDAREAITALTQRANQRDPVAMFELARRYHRGQGVPQDLGEALRLYGVASYLGHAPARRMMDLWTRELSLQPGRSTPALIQHRMQADAQALQRLARIDVSSVGWRTAAPSAGLWIYDDDPLLDLERLPV